MNVFITERGLFSNDRHDYPISHANPVNKVEAPESVSSERSIIREVQQAYVAENTPAYNISISSMGKAALQSMLELSKDFASYYDELASDYTETNTAEPANNEEAQGGPITDETVNEEAVADTGLQNGVETGFINNSGENAPGITNTFDTRLQEELYEPVADDSLQTIYDNVASDIENVELFEETEGTLQTELVEEPGQIEVLNEETEELPINEPVDIPRDDEVEPGFDKLLQPTIEEQENDARVREDIRPDNNPVIRQAMTAYNYQMSYAINLQMTQ
ncbi:MAG: hypothetical protein K6E95_02555 [Lachnospiraceae bacterium]|nr:hypothetical protein [Lachnospiraceae bacterium]